MSFHHTKIKGGGAIIKELILINNEERETETMKRD